MSDMGEMYREWNAHKKEKRASNTRHSTEVLKAYGINFESKNSGAHLIIPTGTSFIDYWPSTGLWVDRSSGKRRRGIVTLIKYMNEAKS